MKKTISVCSAIVLLLVTTWLDHSCQKSISAFQNGLEIPIYFVLTTLLLALAFWVFNKISRSFWVASVFIVIGSFSLFSMSIAGYHFWTSSFAMTQAVHTWYTQTVASTFCFTRSSASMILVIGLLRLLPDKFLWRKEH